MDRRTFLQLTAGAGTGLWGTAAFGAGGNGSNSLESAHFQSDHIVLASQMTGPSPAVIDAIRQRVEADKHSWSWATSTSLQMPNAKLTLLITIMRHITTHYRRPDLFADWALRLVRREELAGTAGHGVGLGHEFQRRQELSTLERGVDWWAFLIPEGIGFDAIDAEPIHLMVVPVFGQNGMKRTIESWAAATRLAKYLNPRKLARNNPTEATDQLNRALARSLHEIRHQDRHHSNGRQS